MNNNQCPNCEADLSTRIVVQEDEFTEQGFCGEFCFYEFKEHFPDTKVRRSNEQKAT